VNSKSITVMGTTWHYHVAGEAADSLLVFAGSLGGSSGLTGVLASAFAGRRVIVPEYAAVGSIRECMMGIQRILAEEGVERTAVYGGSFGGMLVQCFVRKNPESVTALILSGSGYPEPSRAKSNRRILSMLRWLPIGAARVLLRVSLAGMLRTVRQNRDLWKREYERLIGQLDIKALASRYQIAIDFDENYRFHPEDLRSWDGRILLLEGDQDRIAGKKIREGMKLLYPQAALHTFRGAGHASMLTHSEEWAKVLEEFLSKSGAE
jgi:pimeloyl-ACP methyl ester carboxylesterase